MNQIMTQLSHFFMQYNIRQRVIMIGVLIGFISAIIAMLLWANRTEYDLLFGNLDPGSANAIVSDLRSSKVNYRLEDGGTTILVPKEDVAELRLKYAQSGYMKDSISGYELFDKNSMGMTTFMQQLNYKRALEGELMRTINQFPEVKSSRVHLVVPEDRLFENEKKGKASVMLHLQGGASLNSNQINGIAALVANSVEGIESNDVVIMDAQGNTLVDGGGDATSMDQVGNQYQLTQKVEKELQKKVRDIVEGIVGPGNALVEISAALDFDKIERTTEEVNPDNMVVLSEEKYTENSNNGMDSSHFVVEKTTTNYELGKKVERYISNAGGISRLTVAVLLNEKTVKQEDGQGGSTMVREPYSPQELGQVEALVKSAIGFSEERGDVVEVQNMELVKQTPLQEEQNYFQKEMQNEFYKQLITYGLLALGLLLGFLLLRSLLNTSVTQLQLPSGKSDQQALQEGAQPGASEALQAGAREREIPEDAYIKKLSPEAKAKLKANDKMTNEVIEYVSKSPEDASRMLRSWITQGNNNDQA